MDWELCVICQRETGEKLNCPLSSKYSEHDSAYKDFLDRARRFAELDSLPIEFDVSTADPCLWKEKKASWHASCRRMFSADKLQRAEHSSTKSVKDNPRMSQRLAEPAFQKDDCIFCQKDQFGKLHRCSTNNMDEKMRRMALALEDHRLTGILSGGDAIALDILYHRDCFTIYERSHRRRLNQIQHNASASELATEELMSTIEDDIASGVTVFCMRELLDAYQFMVGDTVPNINQTRLKNSILGRSPDFQEQQGSQRRVYLVASSEMRSIISEAIENDYESDAKVLVKAAAVCRRAVSGTDRFIFNDSLQQDTEQVIPPALKQLVRLLLHGPRTDPNLPMFQREKTISELIVYNMEHLSNHGRRETPLPLYVGIWLHSQTRSKKLVKRMNELGVSVSFDRVLAVEKQLAETVAHQARVDGIVCPQNLRKDLFTVAALDNLDHNPSSRTSKGSFHRTAISVFQLRPSDSPGEPRDLPLCSNEEQSRSSQLPEGYTVLSLLMRSLSTDIPSARDRNTSPPKVLDHEVIKERNWMEHVRNLRQEENADEVIAIWSTYHASHLIDTPASLPTIEAILPFFYESSSDPRMVKHGMSLVSQITQFINPGQIPVIAVDQPLYAIAKKLQWTFPNEMGEAKFVVMMGASTLKWPCGKHLGTFFKTPAGPLL